MKYEDEVYSKINLVNSVLDSLNQEPLLINRDFRIDESLHMEHYVKFVVMKPDCIRLELVLVYDILQIHIDRINESFEWSEQQIKENEGEVKDIIKMLFTSTIKVEYCGSNYTKLYFYDKIKNCVKTLKYITGFYWRINCKVKEYCPIFTY